ncbi:outer membrane beta-barrel family protein [Echinicola sp. 20G]|uniref:outer membrane beta-barrel family protein n=1 Tax=Echinicola sp. 20G TaxID=2781961 RepID=UPI001910C24C|nr:outer membrane beta-barrel family protein [Echinicola sp. 20G]
MKAFICYLLFLLFLAPSLLAQSAQEIKGTVMDKSKSTPLPFATVRLLKKSSGEFITGVSTDLDGSFSLPSPSDDVKVEISLLGYSTLTLTSLSFKNGQANLGKLYLDESAETLDEVLVTSEKSETEFRLDKRVFNVGQNLSSAGLSAFDVLNNVPSVTVNIEGEIRLRGNPGVEILINGKPSVLASEQGNALGTITSDMIESIEVITNPSAKYNAEGSSGIINIVLKKEEKRGLNGSVTLNTGIPNNHSLGFSLNNRTEKFNLFSQIGIGHRTFPETNRSINRNSEDSNISSEGDGNKNETFYNVILGTDYHINDLNVLSLTGNFAYEIESESYLTYFNNANAQGDPISSWNRNQSTEATNPKWQYELQYKKDFEDNKDHILLFSAIGNFFGKDQTSGFINTPISGDLGSDDQQQTRTNFNQGEYTFKLDYTHPLTEKVTFETGAQFVLDDVDNDYAISSFLEDEWVVNPNLSNLFEYQQGVLGTYITGAFEGEKFGLKLGLRMEDTNMNTLLVETGETNEQHFTNLFPSVHTSYKLKDNLSLQAGYSRRISRPRLFDLNPFYNIRNEYSVSTGNPLLLPEYADSYEINLLYDHEKFSISSAIYHRYTTDVMEDVTSVENNVSITKPMNIGTNKATGFEANIKYDPIKWWSLSGDFNYNYVQREGEYESTSFDFSSSPWSSRLTSKFGLPANFDLEIIGNYQSSYETFQRRTSGYMFADIGLRKKVWKGKSIINFSIRDVFASRIMETETIQTGSAVPDFYTYNYRMRGRFISLGISFGFGKGEAMEFSGQKRH